MLNVLAREQAGFNQENGFCAGDDFHCIGAGERGAFQQRFEADAAVVRFRLVNPELGKAREFFATGAAGAERESTGGEAVEGVAGDGAEVACALEDGEFVHVIGRVDRVAQAETGPAKAFAHFVVEVEFGGVELVGVVVKQRRVKGDFFGLSVFDEEDAYPFFEEVAGRQQVKAELGFAVADGVGTAAEADAAVLVVGEVGIGAAQAKLVGFVRALCALLRQCDDPAKAVCICRWLRCAFLRKRLIGQGGRADDAGHEIPSVHNDCS